MYINKYNIGLNQMTFLATKATFFNFFNLIIRSHHFGKKIKGFTIL